MYSWAAGTTLQPTFFILKKIKVGLWDLHAGSVSMCLCVCVSVYPASSTFEWANQVILNLVCT
jgi:hypothetical protein